MNSDFSSYYKVCIIVYSLCAPETYWVFSRYVLNECINGCMDLIKNKGLVNKDHYFWTSRNRFKFLSNDLIFFSFQGCSHGIMEVPRLGVESELQLLAYVTATATWDPSQVCNLHHSSQQRQILDLLSEARDRTPCPHGY